MTYLIKEIFTLLNPINPGLIAGVRVNCSAVKLKVPLRIVEVKAGAFNKGRYLLKLFVGVAWVELNDSVENFR